MLENNLLYFLAAAEDLSITNAAKRLYISQQCLSEHIQKLESKYGTKLFVRSPRLALTTSGKALVSAIYKMQRIEASLLDEIKEGSCLQHGSISVGIIQNRATLLLPHILPAFHKQYPNVKIELVYENTTNLESLLQTGKLDFFVGISLSRLSDLEYHILCDEKIFLVISDLLLRDLNISPAMQSEFAVTGVNLVQFCKVPFVVNTKSETLRQTFDSMIRPFSGEVDIPFELDDPQARAMLCAKDFCATIFAESMLPYTEHLPNLNIFPIQHTSVYHYYSVLAHHKDMYISSYKKCFMDLVTEYYQSGA